MEWERLNIMLSKRQSPTYWSSTHHQFEYKNYIDDGFIEFHNLFNNSKLKEINEYLIKIESNQFQGRINEADGITIRSQFNVHNLFPEIIKFLINEKLYHITCQILDDEPLIYQSHINFKKSKNGGSFDWHSDYAYWKSQDGMLEPRAMSIVIPFGAHLSINGGLQVLKKSHLCYYQTKLLTQHKWKLDEIKHGPSREKLQNGLIPIEIINSFPRDDIHQANLNFGDALIMDANTWHFSENNHSLEDRTTFFLILYSNKTPFDSEMVGYRPSYITCRKKIQLKSLLI